VTTGGPDRAAAFARTWETDPTAIAVICDYDGTLAPIVDDPAAARPLPGSAAVLGRLVARGATVAVVSGRPVAFLAAHLPVEGVVLAGRYGLERRVGGATVEHPEAAVWRPPLATLATRARGVLPPGVTVEDKGLSVTFHARAVPGQLGWLRDWVTGQAEAAGLLAHPGKLSVEVRPPVDADKGTVVAGLVEGMAGACACGDDTGDLPAFAALGAARRAGVTTLAVVALSDETPAEVRRAGDLHVDGPAGVLAFLGGLAG
jgi:trehalose 6-phosphate phosphatase